MIEPLPNYNDTTTDNNTRARKKPGRKSNPCSQALRREQNRVAQRVFRERKNQHVLELEEKGRELHNECDKLMSENKALYSGIGALGNERQHLKGLMMSLQLVCLMNNVEIPNHEPYLDKEYLDDMIQDSSIPEMVHSYKKAKDSHKSPETGEQVKKPASTLSMAKSGEYVTTGTILVDHNSVQTVVGRRVAARSFSTKQLQQRQQQQQQHFITTSVPLAMSVWQKPSIDTGTGTTSSSIKINAHCNENNDSDANKDAVIQENKNDEMEEEEQEGAGGFKSLSFSKKSVALTEGTLPSFDLAKFQTMRLQLQLQSVCSKLGSNFKLNPTKLQVIYCTYISFLETRSITINFFILINCYNFLLLIYVQLKIPHDLRIDLIPISIMRDRMIILQGSYDIDDCIRCLLDGMIYQHGDPLKTSSWKFPIEFYERFWFFANDYSVEEIKNRWPGLNKACNDQNKLLLLDDEAFSTQQHQDIPIDNLKQGLSDHSNNITTSDRLYYPPSLSSESSECQSLREEELYSMEGSSSAFYYTQQPANMDKFIIIPAEDDDFGIPWRCNGSLTSNSNYISMYL